MKEGKKRKERMLKKVRGVKKGEKRKDKEERRVKREVRGRQKREKRMKDGGKKAKGCGGRRGRTERAGKEASVRKVGRERCGGDKQDKRRGRSRRRRKKRRRSMRRKRRNVEGERKREMTAHYGPEQPRIQTEVLSRSSVRLFARTAHLFGCSTLRTALIYLLAPLTAELVGK